MINRLLNNSLYTNCKNSCDKQQFKHISFKASPLQSDTIDLSSDAKLEILKQQAASKLNSFAKNIPNLSRTELATEKYNLCSWGGKIISLENIAKIRELSEAEKIELNYYKEKLDLIFQWEDELKKELQAFHPADTVSDNSAIPEHHDVMGYNQLVRFAVESRMNNYEGLSEEEIKKVADTEKLMDKLDNEFKQLPPLEHDCIVYKGVSEHPTSFYKNFNKAFEMMEKAKVGDIVVPDTAYTYTAFDRSTAERWGGEGGRHVDKNGKECRIMMYEIHLPKGAKVSRNFEHRGEVLMPRGAQYKVTDKKVLDNGDIEISLEYILPKE